MTCPDCGKETEDPGYCVSCLLIHQEASRVVAGNGPGVPQDQRSAYDPALWSIQLETALERIRDLLFDALLILDQYCRKCDKYVGAEDGCRKNTMALRARDGFVYCETCFVNRAKSACNAAGISEENP